VDGYKARTKAIARRYVTGLYECRYAQYLTALSIAVMQVEYVRQCSKYSVA
jgi:hypothetical protein